MELMVALYNAFFKKSSSKDMPIDFREKGMGRREREKDRNINVREKH